MFSTYFYNKDMCFNAQYLRLKFEYIGDDISKNCEANLLLQCKIVLYQLGLFSLSHHKRRACLRFVAEASTRWLRVWSVRPKARRLRSGLSSARRLIHMMQCIAPRIWIRVVLCYFMCWSR